MELQGKRIVFLGDSITEGVGTSGVDKIYYSLIGRRTGAQVFGYGIGGTKITPPHFPMKDPHDEWINQQHFITRVDSMAENADIVVIFGGTNDFGWGDAPLGHLHDGRKDTFYGAYHQLILALYNRYPAAQLVIMTPLHRLTEDWDLFNERGIRAVGSLQDYVEAIRRIAQYYAIPLVDLYATCTIQPKVEAQKLRYMPDGLHPNDAGHELIASRLLGVLNML